MDLGRPDRSARLDALAAAYALGTLGGRARRRLARIALRDPVVASAIRAWEWRLASLADSVPDVAPPPRTWEAIRGRLGLTEPASVKAPVQRAVPWWASLGLWRGLAFAGFALAFALGITMLAPRTERSYEGIVVVLAGPDAKPALIATAERGSRYLIVKSVVAADIARDRALGALVAAGGQAAAVIGPCSRFRHRPDRVARACGRRASGRPGARRQPRAGGWVPDRCTHRPGAVHGQGRAHLLTQRTRCGMFAT